MTWRIMMILMLVMMQMMMIMMTDDNDDVEPVREHSALFLLLIIFQAGSRLQSDLRCVHLNLEIDLVLACFIFSVDKLAYLTVIWINNEI